MFPTSHQEIARARHADFLREATQERLAAIAREGRPAAPARLREAGLRWAAAEARKAAARRPAIRPGLTGLTPSGR
jgi:hypothetical protein